MKVIQFILLASVMVSCQQRKVDLSGESKLTPAQFYMLFSPMKTSLKIADTALHKLGDTIRIETRLLQQFIPDTVIASLKINSRDSSYIYPVCHIENNQNHYLIIKSSTKKRHELWAVVLDKNSEYLSCLSLLNTDKIDQYHRDVTINIEPTFIFNKEKQINGELFYTKSAMSYSFENAGFICVMRDSNEDDKGKAVLNPIDTLPASRRYSGDYFKDKRNFLSVRDGRNDSTYYIFLYIEKDGGGCQGELKTELVVSGVGKGYYSQAGDPCVIEFSFSGNRVSVVEDGSCGNRRGPECSFNENYTRKRKSGTHSN
jgi:hypothetical protein